MTRKLLFDVQIVNCLIKQMLVAIIFKANKCYLCSYAFKHWITSAIASTRCERFILHIVNNRSELVPSTWNRIHPYDIKMIKRPIKKEIKL